MSNAKLTLPEVHEVASNCIRDLLADKITEKRSNAICKQTSEIIDVIKIQSQGFKTIGKSTGFDLSGMIYGSK